MLKFAVNNLISLLFYNENFLSCNFLFINFAVSKLVKRYSYIFILEFLLFYRTSCKILSLLYKSI